jgi:hypothetical protein
LKPSSSVTTSAASTQQKQFGQARTALAAVTSSKDQHDSGGEELVQDGVHEHPALKKGTYRLQVVCVGTGSVTIETGSPRKSSTTLSCDGVPSNTRFRGPADDLALNITKRGASSGVIIYQIMRVASA